MNAGTVYLVGAGPGDPGLVTLHAMQLIGTADVIVYDRLVPARVLNRARSDVELIYAGKEPGRPGRLALQPAVGALLGLGTRTLDVSIRDDEPLRDTAFYYARAFQVDGELAWSSPLWVWPAE